MQIILANYKFLSISLFLFTINLQITDRLIFLGILISISLIYEILKAKKILYNFCESDLYIYTNRINCQIINATLANKL